MASDPFSDGRRPMVIISDDEYPFYPHGYLGIPVTSQNKDNTFKIHEYDMEYVNDELHIDPSFVNPWSPHQVNDAGRTLLKLSDDFMNILAERVTNAVGGA